MAYPSWQEMPGYRVLCTDEDFAAHCSGRPGNQNHGAFSFSCKCPEGSFADVAEDARPRIGMPNTLAARRGKKRAILAVAHAMLMMAS
jgi:hypothetical protein